MKWLILTVTLAVMSVPLGAQWLKHPTPGLPRTADGTPNLAAPAPRTADGKPDLSGIWRMNGLGYTFNIFGSQHVDMLPWAKAVRAERAANYAKDSPDTNCLPVGPRAGLFGDPIKLVQTPGLLLIVYEGTPTRQIFLDDRALPVDPNPSWMGYSVGRWEGDTLVVDTIGFNDRTWLDLTGRPHTEALRVTERFRRLDVGHIELQMTFDDPQTYTKPWTIAVEVALAPDTELLEHVCNENEKDHAHLVGQLHDDKKAEVTVAPAVLARYVGVYRAGPIGKLRALVDGGELMIEMPGGGGRHAAYATSDEEFFLPALGASLRFIKDAEGEVTHLRVTTVEGDVLSPRLLESETGTK
ncbi:MAG: hypothetical protein ABI868_06100 [Acidobacteriota bacterium]